MLEQPDVLILANGTRIMYQVRIMYQGLHRRSATSCACAIAIGGQQVLYVRAGGWQLPVAEDVAARNESRCS